MKKEPLISVILPCYNAMPFLPEAIESILNQTYSNLEIICINDGSSDNTGPVLEDYAKKDARIRVLHNETNLKLIQSLNKGVALANGEFIARMDSDDISVPNRFELELAFLHAHPKVHIVSTGYLRITEEGKIVSKNIPRQYSSIACFFASFFYVPIGHAELLIRTDVLKDNPFLYEEHVLHTEDYELWTRLLRKGYQLANIDDFLYLVRLNSQSVSRKFTSVQDDNFVECARLHYHAYMNKTYSTEVAKVLVNRICRKIKLSHLKDGLREMKDFKKYFIQKEEIEDVGIKNELKVIYLTHLFDISYQSLKKGSLAVKAFAMWVLLKNAGLFFNKGVVKYLRTKI